jgi:hypothetical protein
MWHDLEELEFPQKTSQFFSSTLSLFKRVTTHGQKQSFTKCRNLPEKTQQQ